jgi:1,4-alpha-glucan branching enzyme
MTPVVRYDYRVGVPSRGFYKEIFNSDAGIYGGSNVGNQGGQYSEPTPAHGQENSVSVILPPLSVIMLKVIAGKATN